MALTARDIIRAAMRAGVALTVEGESIRYTPASKAPDWMPAAIAANKTDILRELRKPVVKRQVGPQAPMPDGPPTGRNVFDRMNMRSGW